MYKSSSTFDFGGGINACLFGFNGQEKDNEVYGEGNSTTAEYWQYDPRLGRRWNLDPKPQISISDYAAFGNNPVLNVDIKGDEFDVGSSKAKDDVKSMVKAKNRKYLKFEDDGKVTLDFGKLSQKKIDKILKNDEGLNLTNDLVKSSKKFFYDATDALAIVNRDNGKTSYWAAARAPFGMMNLSNGGLNSTGENDSEHMKQGYDGQVIFSSKGKWFESGGEKSRASVLFHELAENYERTHLLNDYLDIKDANGVVIKVGAHNAAIHREYKYWNISNNPGHGNFQHYLDKVPIKILIDFYFPGAVYDN